MDSSSALTSSPKRVTPGWPACLKGYLGGECNNFHVCRKEKLLLCGSSCLAGVLLTSGWSHFLLKPASLTKGCSEVKHFYHVVSDYDVGICIKLRCVACAGAGGVLGSITWLPLLPVSSGGHSRHLCALSTSCSWHFWREQMRVSCKYMCWKHLPGTLN